MAQEITSQPRAPWLTFREAHLQCVHVVGSATCIDQAVYTRYKSLPEKISQEWGSCALPEGGGKGSKTDWHPGLRVQALTPPRLGSHPTCVALDKFLHFSYLGERLCKMQMSIMPALECCSSKTNPSLQSAGSGRVAVITKKRSAGQSHFLSWLVHRLQWARFVPCMMLPSLRNLEAKCTCLSLRTLTSGQG